jgi:hypothetical protein
MAGIGAPLLASARCCAEPVSGNKPISALVLDVYEGVVRSIHLVANPEKLAGVRGFETS